MTKTKTKTLVAIALVTLAVVGTVAGLTIINKRTGEKSSGSSSNYLLKGKGITDPASSGTANQNAATCGNGKLEQGEECDDGNKVSGDGCTGCPTDCQTSFNSIFNIDTASAVACTIANDCDTTGYAQESWTCKNGTCQAASCGDGFCNACRFGACSARTENSDNCAKDCGSPATPATTPTPSVTPSTTAPTADQCKTCAGGCRKEKGTAAENGVTVLDFNDMDLKNKAGTSTPGGNDVYKLAPQEVKYFKVDLPVGGKYVLFAQDSLDQQTVVQVAVQKDTKDGLAANAEYALNLEKSSSKNPDQLKFPDGSLMFGQYAVQAAFKAAGYTQSGVTVYKKINRHDFWTNNDHLMGGAMGGDHVNISSPTAGTYYFMLKNTSTTKGSRTIKYVRFH